MAENREKHSHGNGNKIMNDIMPLVKQYVDKVSLSGIDVSGAILFGSWARGNPRPESDIDICIISPQLGKDWVEEIVRLRQLAFDIDNRIEPIPFTPDGIADKFNPLANEIIKFGVKIRP